MSTPLEESDAPLCFRIGTNIDGLDTPSVRLDQAQRARIRSLSEMQKEALISNTVSGDVWRLVSDEGPYLDGADIAPPPLAFMAVGMVSSYLNEIQALAEERDIEIRDITLVLDNYYTISGSALQGTMIGEALDPDLHVEIEADGDERELQELVAEAIELSPVTGLLTNEHPSQFTLTLNDEPLSPDEVAEVPGSPVDDPAHLFENIDHDSVQQDRPIVRHTGRKTEPFSEADEKYTGKDAAGYADSQDRTIHLRATCTLLDDGMKKIEQKLYSPRGSVFEFLSDEPEEHGGEGRAPDAMTYVAAGLGFCFMTQLGRYSEIVDADLSGYRIVQDTHFSFGGASAGTGRRGQAEPVETHLFLDGDSDAEFAREALDMSEQTCYMHALCRTDLDLDLDVTVG